MRLAEWQRIACNAIQRIVSRYQLDADSRGGTMGLVDRNRLANEASWIQHTFSLRAFVALQPR